MYSENCPEILKACCLSEQEDPKKLQELQHYPKINAWEGTEMTHTWIVYHHSSIIHKFRHTPKKLNEAKWKGEENNLKNTSTRQHIALCNRGSALYQNLVNSDAITW